MRTGMKLIVKITLTAKELTNRVHAPRHAMPHAKNMGINKSKFASSTGTLTGLS